MEEMAMEIKQKVYQTKAESLDQKGRVLIAVNAFNNVDSDGDISAPGSFKKTLKESFDRVRWFLNHDITLLLGVPVKGYEDAGYLKMEAQFNLEKQIAKDTYEDYKLYQEYGKSLEHSVGLQAIKYTIDQDKQTRTITEWKLWEFSTLTAWGANENTPLLGIKSAGDLLKDLTDDQVREVLNKMNNGNYSDARKKAADQAYKSLFVEPSRYTLDERADMRTILKLIHIDTNIQRNG
jgi:HK97 family phage prohead protease